MVISDWVILNRKNFVRNGKVMDAIQTPEAFYRQLECNYLKFFKMDKLCKWAWLGAEWLCDGADVNKTTPDQVAVLLSTKDGCIDVDKKYFESIALPSPALFVYTLPNIMLGEICIRHGFKGEQLCIMSDSADFGELYFNVTDCLKNKGVAACLCGWVNVHEDDFDVCLFRVTSGGEGKPCTTAGMRQLYEQYR